MIRLGIKAACICLLLARPVSCSAQGAISTGTLDRTSIGISAGHYEGDGGLGIDISTPSFFRSHLKFRVRGNFVWLESYKFTTGKWATYQTLWAGVVYHKHILESTNFFCESGTFLISANREFSTQRTQFGYYAVAGLEIYLYETSGFGATYYFSPGLTSCNAHADKLENSPQYANGFVFNTGFRFYF
jgi:hypothetical protein